MEGSSIHVIRQTLGLFLSPGRLAQIPRIARMKDAAVRGKPKGRESSIPLDACPSREHGSRALYVSAPERWATALW